ncbi:MAG: NUDIX hydrolase [Bacteroidetes bacterium]|nr:NUDIX hydrolase [Bacteroidota bacterium]
MNSGIEAFSNRLRVRACGVLIENNSILMVKHMGFGKGGYLWIPPGGGVKHGEKLQLALKREFWEETGLRVEIESFLFVNEFIQKPLHAIEFFFLVKNVGGILRLGSDPELNHEHQMISEVRFLSIDDIRTEGESKVHSRFYGFSSFDELLRIKGFFYS